MLATGCIQTRTHRLTSIYIKFSYKKDIYLDYYLKCNDNRNSECRNPALYAYSQRRWRCQYHSNLLYDPQKNHWLLKDHKFYEQQTKRIAKEQIDKHIHSNRFGVSYDVIIRKFSQLDKTLQMNYEESSYSTCI